MLQNGTWIPHFTLISISSFLMSDGEFPGQNIQPNRKGTGNHWYTQCNCIQAWSSQASSYDSSRRQRPSPVEIFQDLFHSLNQDNTSFSVFTLFKPSFSYSAGTMFPHANFSLDNYVSGKPCKGEKCSERTNERTKKCLDAICEGMGNHCGRKTKNQDVRNTIFNFYLLACQKRPWCCCRF